MARAERKRRNLDSTRGPNMISSPRKDSHPLTSMTGKNSVNSHMASSLAGGDAPSFTYMYRGPQKLHAYASFLFVYKYYTGPFAPSVHKNHVLGNFLA